MHSDLTPSPSALRPLRSTPSIKVENISKNYDKVVALDNISFEINKGELFGFIGPDGAGKTTLFRILTTLLIPDKGIATVEELDVVKDYKKLRKILGYMPGRFSLYQDLSVEENLKFYATIFNTTIEENYHLIKDIYSQIEPFKKRRAGKLSGGMKQKLALSCAMIHKPEVLILDEPTTGVDAVSRKEFWEMLKKLKESGITIVVSTPYMDEASLCDRVALMQNGKIFSIDRPQNITKQFNRTLIAIRSNQMYKLINDLRGLENTYSVYPFGDFLHYTSKENKINANELFEFLKKNEHKDVEIKEIEANVEDCFIELTKKAEGVQRRA
ncbi:MAG: ABC transporter ATP-binding protein [Bacteroidales bacterium]|nr:ABC transporter ATP-binding protein [Bacteroidales bacterium]